MDSLLENLGERKKEQYKQADLSFLSPRDKKIELCDEKQRSTSMKKDGSGVKVESEASAEDASEDSDLLDDDNNGGWWMTSRN